MVNEIFLAALPADFEAHGASVIEQVRRESPAEWLKLIAALVSEDLKISVDTGDATGGRAHGKR